MGLMTLRQMRQEVEDLEYEISLRSDELEAEMSSCPDRMIQGALEQTIDDLLCEKMALNDRIRDLLAGSEL